MKRFQFAVMLSCFIASAYVMADVAPPFPIGQNNISSDYGPRIKPSGGSYFHRGIDYPQSFGTPILAVESGTISDIIRGSNSQIWKLEISGSNGNPFAYVHIFDSPVPGVGVPLVAGRYELHVNSDDLLFIVRFTDSLRTPAANAR